MSTQPRGRRAEGTRICGGVKRVRDTASSESFGGDSYFALVNGMTALARSGPSRRDPPRRAYRPKLLFVAKNGTPQIDVKRALLPVHAGGLREAEHLLYGRVAC